MERKEKTKRMGEAIGYDHFGRGIIKQEGKVVFVPHVKKGDTVSYIMVKEKKHYAIGRTIFEEKTLCPSYQECGGCQILHLSYPEQLAFKQEKVKNILEHYTKYSYEKEIPILKTEPFFYRNKVILHIKGKEIGFYQEETNKIVPFSTCLLLKKKMLEVIASIRFFLQKEQGLTEAMIRVLEDQVLLSLKGTLSKKKISSFFLPLCDILFYNEEALTKKTQLEVKIFDTLFVVSKDSFFQVNDLGLKKIYQTVIDFVKDTKRGIAFDLYCGTGTLSLLIAPYEKEVYGVELSKEAIRNANVSKKRNNIENVSFFAQDTGVFLSQNKKTPDLILVDPPRAGLSKKVRQQMKECSPKYILYVSCDPLTLARDLEEFRESYQLENMVAIDEFPNTYHMECVALLMRKVTKRFH